MKISMFLSAGSHKRGIMAAFVLDGPTPSLPLR